MHTDQHLVPASTIGAVADERTSPWRHVAIGAAALIAVAAPAAAITWSDGGDGPSDVRRPPAGAASVVTAETDTAAITRDLAERGLIPPEAAEPAVAVAVMTDADAATRDLVERGLIPPESLSGG